MAQNVWPEEEHGTILPPMWNRQPEEPSPRVNAKTSSGSVLPSRRATDWRLDRKGRPINDSTSMQYLRGRSPGTGRNDPKENGGAGRTPSIARGGWIDRDGQSTIRKARERLRGCLGTRRPKPKSSAGIWRRGPESNRRIEDLQSPALPLGYRAALQNP